MLTKEDLVQLGVFKKVLERCENNDCDPCCPYRYCDGICWYHLYLDAKELEKRNGDMKDG